MGNAYLDIHKPAQRQFREPRRAEPSGVIVIHTAESVADLDGLDTGAEGVAKFIQDRTGYGSYHRLVDSDSIVKLVRFGCEAYGDSTGSNPHAIHISAACRTVDWKRMTKARRAGYIANLAKAANEARIWLKREHGVVVPAERITRAESEKRVPGFISHGERDPGRRSDPGADFPWDEFMAAYTALAKPTTVIAPAKPAKKVDKARATRRLILKAEQQAKKDGVLTARQRKQLAAIRVTNRLKKK